MAWLTILFGIVLGFVIAGLKEYSEKKTHSPQRTTTRPSLITRYDTRDYYEELRRLHRQRMWELSGLRELSGRQQATNDKGEGLVENWRKSIVGLMKLADKNLSAAKQNLEIGNHTAAVEAASTSVENIARALIHCFGGKPDPDFGQEEALRMLSVRFEDDEKTEFEKGVAIVAQLSHNKAIPRRLSRHTIQRGLFDEARTRQMIKSSSKVVNLFKQIMTERFEDEIPELREACPKCRSLNICVWSFGNQMANYECNNCHSKWNGPQT